MVELQEHLETFERHNIWVCAISYDPVDMLAWFAIRFGITYPLLSDTDSTVIRRFGILNTNVPEDHPWYGVPFPGTFLIDQEGRVISKSFYANHAVRDSVTRMLHEGFAITDPPNGEVQMVEDDSLLVRASLSSLSIRPGRVITFTMEIQIKERRHIYGFPLPEGYVPTTLVIDEIEGIDVGGVEYPEPKLYRFEALGETVRVYEGHLILKAPIRCNRRRTDCLIKVHLRYQACDDRECYLPGQVDVELPLRYLENV